MQTYRINKFVMKKLKNGFFLWTKILIKIETRVRKNSQKKFIGRGGGAVFLEGNFPGVNSLGCNFPGHFSGGHFSRGNFS